MRKRLRLVLVLMHLATAFGWFAATLVVLLLAGHGHPAAAAYVDDNVLADLSFMTLYTGLMLAGTASWGYTRFWWVTVKLVATVGLALGGRALSHNGFTVVGGLLTVTAIAALAWIGRTKPWGRLRQGPAHRHWNHPAVYAVILVTPVLDYVTDLPLQAVPVAALLISRAWPPAAGAAARRSRRTPAERSEQG